MVVREELGWDFSLRGEFSLVLYVLGLKRNA
jgi:hypothetical protein